MRILIINILNDIHIFILIKFIIKGIGIIIVISISKIRNINLIEKKWIEKGTRNLVSGSNPHSKGDFFSRWEFLWILIIGVIFKIKIIIVKLNKKNIHTKNIILPLDFLVGS